MLAFAAEESAASTWLAMPDARLPERLPVSAQTGWAVRALAAQFEASDATPVRALSGDWSHYRPRDTRNAALQSARIELSASRASWELGTVLRSDIVIDGSRGAFDIVYAYKQKREPPPGSTFELNATEQGVIWAGLRGARTWTLRPGTDNGVQLTTSAALLSVRRVQLTDVSGNAQFSSAAGFEFNAQTTRQDSHVQFGGYGQPKGLGSGYTTDIGLLWQPSARSFVNFSVTDAFSKLKVRNVATEQLSASSSTRLFDSSGYLDYRPLLNGRNSTQDVALRLVRKWTLSAGTRLDGSVLSASGESPAASSTTVGARWEHVAGIDVPSIWVSVPLTVFPQAGLALQLDVDGRFKSVGVGLKSRIGAVMLRSQSTSVGDSRALGWQANLNWAW